MLGYVASLPYILNNYIPCYQVSSSNRISNVWHIISFAAWILQAATKQLPWSDFNQHVHLPFLPLHNLSDWSPCCPSPCSLLYLGSTTSILHVGVLWMDCSGGGPSLQKPGSSFGIPNNSICLKIRIDSLE